MGAEPLEFNKLKPPPGGYRSHEGIIVTFSVDGASPSPAACPAIAPSGSRAAEGEADPGEDQQNAGPLVEPGLLTEKHDREQGPEYGHQVDE